MENCSARNQKYLKVHIGRWKRHSRCFVVQCRVNERLIELELISVAQTVFVKQGWELSKNLSRLVIKSFNFIMKDRYLRFQLKFIVDLRAHWTLYSGLINSPGTFSCRNKNQSWWWEAWIFSRRLTSLYNQTRLISFVTYDDELFSQEKTSFVSENSKSTNNIFLMSEHIITNY